MDHDDEQARIARLLAELEANDQHELDPNDVARLAGGGASDGVRDAIQARLAGDDASLAATLASEAEARSQESRSSPLRWVPAAAAVLALAVGGWWLLQGNEDGPLGDADLVTAFAALRDADPQTFDGIEPLLAAERATGAAPRARGGLRVAAPLGALLDRRPEMRWDAVDGASRYDVEVVSDEGEAVLERKRDEAGFSWPEDVPGLEGGGRYVLQITTTVAGVRLVGSSAFRVLSDTEQARYRRALAAVDARVPDDLRALARAHIALRLDLLSEAERHLRGAAATNLVNETRAHLRRRMGSP